MEYGLSGRHNGGITVFLGTGIQIPIKIGKVTAGNVHPYAMARLEQVAGGIYLDGIFVYIARIYERWRFIGLPIARPDDSMAELLDKPVGPDILHIVNKGDSEYTRQEVGTQPYGKWRRGRQNNIWSASGEPVQAAQLRE